MNPITIGICGLGTVAGGTVTILQRNRETIAARIGRPIIIKHIGARRDNPTVDTTDIPISRDIFAVAQDPDVDIVVELIGGTTTAKELVLQAINHGKSVVTANKALIAEHGNELLAAAATNDVTIAFEAAVAGGIPIIKALREGLAANRIDWLAGIINGTGNFILSAMRNDGRNFDEVLREAQALGYAEADPRFDVEGIDAAHKLAILASLAFGIPLQFSKVYTEGISQLAADDLQYAKQLGYRIKHLGIARHNDDGSIELRVHPTLIPEKCLIAAVEGVMNAVLVHGDAAGSTLYYGAGAGAEPTASAVVADIIDVARGIQLEASYRIPHLAFQTDKLDNTPVLAMDDINCAHYLRMSVQDEPGVLSQITQQLSAADISIEAVIQKEPTSAENRVPLVILTNRCSERALRDVLATIQAMPTIDGAITHIRVETLDG